MVAEVGTGTWVSILILLSLFQVMMPSWIQWWVGCHCSQSPSWTRRHCVLPCSSAPNSALNTSPTPPHVLMIDSLFCSRPSSQVPKRGEDVPQWQWCHCNCHCVTAKISLPLPSFQIGHRALRQSLQWTHSLKNSEPSVYVAHFPYWIPPGP